MRMKQPLLEFLVFVLLQEVVVRRLCVTSFSECNKITPEGRSETTGVQVGCQTVITFQDKTRMMSIHVSPLHLTETVVQLILLRTSGKTETRLPYRNNKQSRN